MLPCNVVVYEDDAAHAVVVAVDPLQNPAVLEDPRVRKVAETVRVKLGRVLAHLS
jgi:hypothetical protein